MHKVLITDDVHEHLISGLKTRHYHVDYLPDIKWEEVYEIIDEYYGIVINTKTYINKALLDKAKQLKWIGRLGSGMEIIDIVYAREKNIALINTPEANRNAVAEHALGMLLSVMRNLPRANKELKENLWYREKNRGEELSGKCIGIIGYGNNGSRFVEILEGLNVKVLIFDKYKQLNEIKGRFRVVNDVQQIQNEADIISLHVPLTTETNRMIDKVFIENCKKPFILINTARGKVVDTESLLSALKSGKVRAACLDVFENEKPESYNDREKEMYQELFSMENVVVSPHIAGWTHESKRLIAEILLKKLDELNFL